MSHYIPGALGEFRGRTGQLVVSIWRRIKIGRSRPGKTRRRSSNSQKVQRSRFGLISRFLREFVLVIRNGFPSARLNMTSMNLAIKHNIKTSIKGEQPNIEIDESLIKLSKGNLDQVKRPRVIIDESGDVHLEWKNPERQKSGVSDHDPLQLVLYSNALRRRQLIYVQDLALRADEIANIKKWVVDLVGPVHVWMFLRSVDSKKVSDSKYLGVFDFENKSSS